jgi:hypothetical protein
MIDLFYIFEEDFLACFILHSLLINLLIGEGFVIYTVVGIVSSEIILALFFKTIAQFLNLFFTMAHDLSFLSLIFFVTHPIRHV